MGMFSAQFAVCHHWLYKASEKRYLARGMVAFLINLNFFQFKQFVSQRNVQPRAVITSLIFLLKS